MSSRRLATIALAELSFARRRPLTWVWLALVLLSAWGMSTGNVQISTGDSSVGGEKAWLTSEFSQSFQWAALGLMVHAFFACVASGMSILRDGESRVAELLHATPLSPAEYVWGKFLGLWASFAVICLLHALANAGFNHLLSGGEDAEFIGPFALASYLVPPLLFTLPALAFLSGGALALGALVRRPVLIYFLPVAVLLGCGFFLWTFAPHWLSVGVDRSLMALDPAGLRWLQRTWLEVDRGVAFYNTQPVACDALFVLSRLGFVALGLAGVVLTQARLARALRGAAGRVPRELAAVAATSAPVPGPDARLAPGLAALGMRARRARFAAQIWNVARVELRELRGSPGLYLFVPLIVLQGFGSVLARTGAFDTPILWTSGLIAQGTFNTLSLLVTLLLLFYTVESLERERAAGFDALLAASPVASAAVLFGKVLANSFVGVVVLGATLIASWVALLTLGQGRLEPEPFLVVWGLLLVPTFALWSAFVSFLWCLTRNRYAVYGLALGALVATFWFQFTGSMNWVFNWNLWSTVTWSDLAPLELDPRAYVQNRVLAASLAVLFVALAVRWLPRREADPVGRATRLAPARLARAFLAFTPFLLVPALSAVALAFEIRDGYGGSAYEKAAKDYWRKGFRTWVDAPKPALTGIELELELDPPRSFLASRGTFHLANDGPEPLGSFALTTGRHWRDLAWTVDGQAFTPRQETALHVFELPERLAPGAALDVGFAFHGRFPEGVSKNGPGRPEFVLPGGVVLTSFTPSFVPVVGFMEGLGVDEENRYEPREYPDDFHLGPTPSGFGVDVPYPVDVTVRGPAEYAYNSVGVMVSDAVEGSTRTTRWRSDRPVLFFNVVAGRWAEHADDGTRIFHAPEHAANVEAMSAALVAARRWYGEWFSPYPWQELKLSEFPGYAGYAQGFPTNITFSENIGFLTAATEQADAPFLVTAHEAAHQWWGNRLVPGEGPGGNILSEGTSHFSTILLFEQEKGVGARIEFCRALEDRYGRQRSTSSERSLAKTDGSRDGDTTVTYDKGGWVFWMLLQHLGRERGLAGYRSFLERYEGAADHPVIQDFVEHVRPLAADPAAFDEFARQWFFDVVVPEYELRDVGIEEKAGGGWSVRGRLVNKGTGRMAVEVAASTGERFPDRDENGDAAGAELADTTYSEARCSLVLGSGEEAPFEIDCDFEPERVLVDPDAVVLMLNRKLAVADLGG
jgi:ABC-type transport system involved in multi-copper enzyme maturation permease subunit